MFGVRYSPVRAGEFVVIHGFLAKVMQSMRGRGPVSLRRSPRRFHPSPDGSRRFPPVVLQEDDSDEEAATPPVPKPQPFLTVRAEDLASDPNSVWGLVWRTLLHSRDLKLVTTQRTA